MDFTATNYTAIDVGSINLYNHRHQMHIDEDSEDEDDKRRKVKLDMQLEKEFDALDTNALMQNSYNYPTQFSLQNNNHCNHNLVNLERPDNRDFTEHILTVGVLPTQSVEVEVSEDEDDIKRKIHLDKCLEAEFDYVNEDEILQNSSNIRVVSSYNGKSNFFQTKMTDNNNQSKCEEIEFVNFNGGFQYNYKKDQNQLESSLIGVTLQGATKLTSVLNNHSDSDEDEDDVRRKVKLDQQLEKEFNVMDTNALLQASDDYPSQISIKSDCANHEFPENFLTAGALPTPTMLNLERKNVTAEDSEDEDDIKRKIQLNKCLEEELEELNEDNILNGMTDIYDHAPFFEKNAQSNECKKVEVGNAGRGSNFIHMIQHEQMNKILTERSSQEATNFRLGLKIQTDEFGNVNDDLGQKTKFNLVPEKKFGSVDSNDLLLVEKDAETPQRNRCNEKNNYSFDNIEGRSISFHNSPPSTLKFGSENYFKYSSGAENNYDSNEKLDNENLSAASEILHLSNGTQSGNIPLEYREFREYSSNINALGLDPGTQPFSNSEYCCANVDTIEVEYGCADKLLIQNGNGQNSGLNQENKCIETSSYSHLKQLYEVRGKELDQSADQIASLKLKLDNIIDERDLLSASKKELEIFLTDKDNRIKGLYNDLEEKNESLNRILEDNSNIKRKLDIAEHKVSNLQLQLTKLKSSNYCKTSQNVQESFVQRLRAFHSEEVEDLNKKLESYRQRYSDAEVQVKILEKKLLETRNLNDKQLEEKIIHIKELQAKLKAEEQIKLLVSNPRSSSDTDREKELINEIECLQDKLRISEKELKCYGMMLKNEVFKSLVPSEDSSDCLGLIRNLNFDESRTGTPDVSFAVTKSSSPNKRNVGENESLKQIPNEGPLQPADSKQISNSALLKDNISLREQNVKLIENYSIINETAEKLLLSMNDICNEIKYSPKDLGSVPYALLIEESNKLTKYMENFGLLQQQTFEQRNLENMRLKELFLSLNDQSLKEIKENMQTEYESIIKCLKAEMNRLSEKLNDAENKHDSLFREKDELKEELCNIKVYSNKIESQLVLSRDENLQLKTKIENLGIQRDTNSRLMGSVSGANAESGKDAVSVEKAQDLIYRLNILENENKHLKVQVNEKAHIEQDLQNLKTELQNLNTPSFKCHNPSDVRDSECPGGPNELQNVATQIETYRSWSEKVIELNSQLKSYKQQIHEKDQQLNTLTSLFTGNNNHLFKEKQELFEAKEKVEHLSSKIKLLEESKSNLLVKHGEELKAVINQLRKQETLEIERRKQWEVKLSVHNRMTRNSEKEKEKLTEEIKNLVMQTEEKNKKYDNLKLKFFKLQKNKTSVEERLYFYQKELKACEGNESELLASVTSWATQVKHTLTHEISLVIDELKSLQKNSFLKAADLVYTMSHLSWIIEKLTKLQITEI